MKIVLKHQPAYEIDTVTEAEAAALRCWYDGSATAQQEEVALDVVRSAHARDGWIACDCLSGPLPPLLAPVRLPAGYTLKRLTRADDDPLLRADRPNHAEDCPFRFEKDVERSRPDSRFVLRPIPLRPTAYFDGLPAFAERLAAHGEAGPALRATRSDRPSALGLQLWRLLDGAGLNRLPPLRDELPSPTLSTQLSRIKDHAKTQRVLRTWRLSSLLSTWPKDVFDADSYWQQNFRRSKPDWPSSQRPTAFMVAFSKFINDHAVYTAACELPIEVASKVRRPLRGDPQNKGPFLTIINFDAGEDSGGPLRAVQAYAQPVHAGDTLFPVESGFERDVLNLILQARGLIRNLAPELRIGIIKPLFDLPTRFGPCRPDFVLEVAQPGQEAKTLIVEAMGFDTPEYEAAKAITLPRMQAIGPLITIRPREIAPSVVGVTCTSLARYIIDQPER